MKLTKKIIYSSLILGVSCMYGGIGVFTKDGKRVNNTQENKLELNFSTHKNINIITPITVVEDRGEADNLSNYLLKNLEKGKLPIKEGVVLHVCGKKTYILSIGINNYYNIQKLQYAVSDAKIVPAKIERSCQNTEIKWLLDQAATKENIIRNIEEISRKTTKEDTFILFYSGMGATIKNEKFMLPVDTLKEKAILKHAIALDSVGEILGDKKANVFIFADTCFSPLREPKELLTR